ncbi:hypothetical protein KBC70_04625 [Candidatus Woesebacteria bacterium]|nr:hypothetical protein [Candidatus Woesebacteria bacterium]
MDTDKAAPTKNTEFTIGQNIFGWSCVFLVGWIIFELLGVVIHGSFVTSKLELVVYAYNEREMLSRGVVTFLNTNELEDTRPLANALREIERAQILLDNSDLDAHLFRIFEQQHSDLNKALEAVDTLKIHSVDGYKEIKVQLDENARRIEKSRKEYNDAALEFNIVYSRGFPERYMGVDQLFLLSETEAIGKEFAPLYGTPSPK